MENFQQRCLDPDPVFKKCMDPDPVCPNRLDPDPDPDPVNIRPDPQPCYCLYNSYLMLLQSQSPFSLDQRYIHSEDNSSAYYLKMTRK